jgi:two-component system chemotaxis response regulator CheY
MARILIVDDDAQIRTVLRAMLEREGYDVIEAADGREGLARSQATPVDVILLDLLMPEQEGLETIRMLRQGGTAVKIIAMSGGGQTGRMDFLDAAAVMGAQRTLRKPFRQQELLDAVWDLLQGDV